MKSFTKQTAMCVLWYSVTAKNEWIQKHNIKATKTKKKMNQTEENQNFFRLKEMICTEFDRMCQIK